jgi:hypothetical protein
MSDVGNERPRERGRFVKGAVIYTRFDGRRLWVRHSWDPVEEDLFHTLLNVDKLRRFLRAMAFVIAVAIVLYIKGWA